MSVRGRERGRGTAGVPLVLAAPLLLLLTVPIVALVMRTTPRAIWEALLEAPTRQAVMLSVLTSAASLLIAIVLGLPLAYWLATSRSRVVGLATALVDLPTVLPPSVAGLALLLTLGRRSTAGGLLESWGLSVAFTPAAVVIAQVFVASPYFVRAARAGFASVSADLVDAAALDGATRRAFLMRVLIPLSWRALGAGAAMCWCRALGEFGATIIFAGNLPGWTQTMPLAVYLGLEQNMDRALVLATILIGIAVTVLGCVRVLGPREGPEAPPRGRGWGRARSGTS